MTEPTDRYSDRMARATAPAELVREELARLMDSETMRRAPTHARLLRFLVERRVAGDESALREASIALEVFRRDPATYDARTDPIVRVTIGRLRDRLAAHYSHFSTPPKLRILLPRGGYAPHFVAQPGAEAARARLAVLRTRNRSGLEALDVVAGAFADRLTDRLVAVGYAGVVPRASVEQAQADAPELRAVAARLGAAWLVDTTIVRETRDEVRVSVRLIAAADASVLWVETAVAQQSDAARLAERMLDAATLRIVEAMPGGIAAQDAARPAAQLPRAARAALERARLMLLQRSARATAEALALAETVAHEHPAAAEGWSTVASARYSQLSFGDADPADATLRMREAASRALAIDPADPVALRTLAIVAGRGDHAFDAAEALFTRALGASPAYTSARLNYAELLALAGRHDAARLQLNLARLHDPQSPSVHLACAVCHGYARRRDEARAAWALCRASGESSVWVALGEGLNELADGNVALAATLIDEAAGRLPDLPAVLVSRATLRAAQGDAAGAAALERECDARFPGYSPAHRAVPAAWRGDRATAIARMAEATAARDMQLLAATLDPVFDAFDDEPGWRALRAQSPIWSMRPAAHAA